jgi:hypothetical protein
MVAFAQSGAIERMLQTQNGSLAPEVARAILSWSFADSDQTRVSELSAKARAGTLSEDETRELDWYLLLGDLLTILQSKARTSLRKHSSTP